MFGINMGRQTSTRTDYVNKYSSTLQTTLYNFSATDTTTENRVGVVKAQPLHPKDPCQLLQTFKCWNSRKS